MAPNTNEHQCNDPDPDLAFDPNTLTSLSLLCLSWLFLWPLPPDPRKHNPVTTFCFEFTSGRHTPLPAIVFVLLLSVLSWEEGKLKQKGRNISHNLSEEYLTVCHGCLGVHEGLFCLSSDVPPLWLMHGLLPRSCCDVKLCLDSSHLPSCFCTSHCLPKTNNTLLIWLVWWEWQEFSMCDIFYIKDQYLCFRCSRFHISWVFPLGSGTRDLSLNIFPEAELAFWKQRGQSVSRPPPTLWTLVFAVPSVKTLLLIDRILQFYKVFAGPLQTTVFTDCTQLTQLITRITKYYWNPFKKHLNQSPGRAPDKHVLSMEAPSHNLWDICC